METKRLFDQDPLKGTTTEFIYEHAPSGRESEDSVVINTKQDVTDIIRKNQESRNIVDRHQRYGDWSKVASLPLTVYYDLKTKGVLDDEAAFKRWLNNPDNRFFRTREGRV